MIIPANLEKYILDTYGMSFENFIYEIMSTHFAKMHLDKSHNFFYTVKANSKTLFESLMKLIKETDSYKLLNIRKYPFLDVVMKSLYLLITSCLLKNVIANLLMIFGSIV